MNVVPDVFILAAASFDEVSVVTCLSELRKAGITAVLVTPIPGLVSSKRGITLRPDLSLAQINEFTLKKEQIVVVAGGAESATAVLIDPRTHHLLQQILAANGLIAGLRYTCHLIEELELHDGRFLWQGGEETAVFIQQLINIHLQK